MNEKVIQVMEKILDEPEKIQEVTRSNAEIFFSFGGQILSVLKREPTRELGAFGLYFYPKWRGGIRQLISTQEFDPESINMIHYNDADSPAHKGLFRRLYDLLEERSSGIDDVLDDILNA